MGDTPSIGPGYYIAFRDDITDESAGGIRYVDGLSGIARGYAQIEPFEDAPTPVANIQGPSRVGVCDDVSLKGDLSTGGAGRPLSYEWSSVPNKNFNLSVACFDGNQRYADQITILNH